MSRARWPHNPPHPDFASVRLGALDQAHARRTHKEVSRMDWLIEYLAVWGVWVLLFLALVVGLALWMNSTPWD